jgi:murein DD-endopeptidase MepM/ murein hydrolase activator NlpD
MQASKIQASLLIFAQVSMLMAACAPVLITPETTPTVPATEAPATVPVPEASSQPPTAILNQVEEDPTLQPSNLVVLPLICSPLAVQPLEQIAEIITQPFAAPRQLADGTYKDDAHHGLDLGYYTRNGINFTGTPVLSATHGRIAAILYNRPPYGDAILVETLYAYIPAHLIESQSVPPGDSLYILYAHLQNMQPLELNQEITCGQPIAETGLTGFTGGPHLHFETRLGPAGQTFDSMAYYQTTTTEQERANYVTWRMSGTFRLFDPMILLSPPAEK